MILHSATQHGNHSPFGVVVSMLGASWSIMENMQQPCGFALRFYSTRSHFDISLKSDYTTEVPAVLLKTFSPYEKGNMNAQFLSQYPTEALTYTVQFSFKFINPKTTGSFFSKCDFIFLMLFTLCAIVLYKTGPIQWMFSQHCGDWWPGALAPGHQ